MLSLALSLSWLACASPPPVDSAQPPLPTITSLTLSCERDTETWELELETSGWVDSATWWIAAPDLPVETHSVRSRSASPSGDYERLSLSLDQLADPRLQENNSSTAALCHEPRVAMRLSIFEPDAGALAECRQWGGPLDWSALNLTEDCEITDLWW